MAGSHFPHWHAAASTDGVNVKGNMLVEAESYVPEAAWLS